jgi:polysaccharide export outer membrane protein
VNWKSLGRANIFGLLFSAVAALSGCNNTTGSLQAGDLISSSLGGEPGNLKVVAVLPPPENTRQGADQLISENDLLEIDVFQVDDLDRTVRVDSNGRITMPLIGAIQAAGKTIPTVEQDLERIYGVKYLQSPEITVFMKESSGQRMTLDGQFNKPGIYQTTTSSSLLQAVAQASGFTSLADETKVYVFRQFGETKLVANYSITDIRNGKKSDPRLFGGDIVVAFTSSSKVALNNLKSALGIASSAARLAVPF